MKELFGDQLKRMLDNMTDSEIEEHYKWDQYVGRIGKQSLWYDDMVERGLLEPIKNNIIKFPSMKV